MSLELLKFEAEWCGPCSQQSTILEEYHATPVRSIDVDEDTETANEYSVRGLPTLVLLNDGEPVERWSGVTQLEEIKSVVDGYK
jgi:thioredoxin 1